MRVCVVGAGYVGLPLGLVLAEAGDEVWIVETDAERLAALRAGASPLLEPGLSERISLARYVASPEEVPDDVALWFIAVGTPSGPDGAADLSALWAAAGAIATRVSANAVVALKSTVPVGTTEAVQTRLAVPVVYAPEFLRQGSAVEDTRRPHRILLGTDDPSAAERVLGALRRIVAPGTPALVHSPRTAELAKYTANAMLAARISLMNEVAAIAAAVGADVEDVRRAVGADPRIGPAFLAAGPGFGGSCLPKDLRALIRTAEAAAVEPVILRAIAQRNDANKVAIVRAVREALGGDVRGVAIAMWGLAFKPGTDDVREAPSLDLATALLAAGATLRVHDPVAVPAARRALGDPLGVAWCADPYAAADGCEAILLVTEWPVYRTLDLERVRRALRGDHFFDLRNQYVPQVLVQAGFAYHGVGRRAP